MELQEMCKSVRTKLNMTQTDFATLIGSNQTEISFIERGFIPNDMRKVEIIKDLYYETSK